jgi:hypothetical protein
MASNCILCGKKVFVSRVNLLLNDNSAVIVDFGKNYCVECGNKRREILEKAFRADNDLGKMLKPFEKIEKI